MTTESRGPFEADMLALWYAGKLAVNDDVRAFTEIHPTELSGIKTGRRFPNRNERARIAACFNTTERHVLELSRAAADARYEATLKEIPAPVAKGG